MSKQGYKFFDLAMLTVIAFIIEAILVYASNQVKFMAEGFSVSFAILFSLIGMFRWDLLGVVPGIVATIGGIVIQNSFNNGAYDFVSTLANIVGVLSTMVLVIYLKKFTKSKIKENILYLILYSIIGYALYISFTSLVWGVFSKDVSIIETFKIMVTRNLLNLLMSSIVLVIANKQKDFLVDMNEYLIKLHSVPESARIRKEINEKEGQSLTTDINSSKETNDISLLDGGMLSEEDLIKLNKHFKEKEGDKYGTRKS